MLESLTRKSLVCEVSVTKGFLNEVSGASSIIDKKCKKKKKKKKLLDANIEINGTLCS